MSHPTLATSLRAVACLASFIVVVACGGGGSVGSGGTGATLSMAEGTVNGFGSIVVDGIRFDDHDATTVTEDQPGRDVLAEAELGDRVELEFDDDGRLRTLRVEAALNGTVASAAGTSGQFVVLGQTVRINTDRTKGPITQFGGGYTGPADVKAGDTVAVHGILVPQGQGAIVQATRVQRKDAPPAFLRVTGVVSDLAGGTFKLGTLTVTTAGALVVPAGTALANGQIVRVLAPPAALAGSSLAASLVRIKRAPQEGQLAQVSGVVASLDTTARTFFIGTQKVDYAAQASQALANGDYVRVRGRLAAGGTLVASDIDVRDNRNEPEAELHGNISNLDATAKTFTVRDVDVDASGVTPQSCPSGLADGLFVEVEGTLSSTGLIASSVRCAGEPSGGTVERDGVAGTVSATARTFVLTTPRGAVNVSWNDRTFFRDVTPATLDGKLVEVDGVVNGTTLVASKVRLEH